MTTRFGLVALFLASAATLSAADDSVITYHNGIHRQGAYIVPDLTVAAATNMQRDTKFKASISGNMYAQPLFWNPKGAKRGLVIAATESNNVYALDEISGATVWQRALGQSVPHSQLPCGNIDPVGITGTPVIDPTSATLYLAALVHTKNGAKHKRVCAVAAGRLGASQLANRHRERAQESREQVSPRLPRASAARCSSSRIVFT